MSDATFDNWAGGADNIDPVDRLPDGTYRDAINFDPTNAGKMQLRAGYTKRAQLNAARGAVPYGLTILIADQTELKQYNTLSSSVDVIGTLPGAGFFAGAELNGQAYLCTPSGRMRVKGSEVLPWGIEAPSFSTMAIVSGQLKAGNYRVAMTSMSADGIESGTIPMILSLAPDTGLSINFSLPPGAVTARLYATVDNGDTLFLQDERAAGGFALSYIRNDTARLMTENLATPPVGEIMTVYRSRLLIAHVNNLYFTEPFAPHLYNRMSGFVSFGAPITNVLALDGVVAVSAGDETFMIFGLGTDDIRMDNPIHVGGIRSTGVVMPDGRGAWMTKYGQAFISPAGAVELPNRTRYAPPVAEYGTAGIVENRGSQVIVTGMRGRIDNSTLGFNDYIDGEFTP